VDIVDKIDNVSELVNSSERNVFEERPDDLQFVRRRCLGVHNKTHSLKFQFFVEKRQFGSGGILAIKKVFFGTDEKKLLQKRKRCLGLV
jgi:hypothetical protein